MARWVTKSKLIELFGTQITDDFLENQRKNASFRFRKPTKTNIYFYDLDDFLRWIEEGEGI